MLTPSLLLLLALPAADAVEITIDPSVCDAQNLWEDYCLAGAAAGCTPLTDLQFDINQSSETSPVCARVEGTLSDLTVSNGAYLVMTYEGASELVGGLEGLSVRSGGRAWIEPLDANSTLQIRGGGQEAAVTMQGTDTELHLDGATLAPGLAQAAELTFSGGVIDLNGGAQLELVGGRVEGGTAAVGGGLYVGVGCEALVQGTVFADNSAGEGGDIYAHGFLEVEDASFGAAVGGDPVTHGGAIASYDSLVVRRSDFVGRPVEKGGAIFGLGELTQSVVLEDVDIVGGDADLNGGAVYLSGHGAVTLDRVTIEGTSAGDWGGAVYIAGNSGLGDAVVTGLEVTNATAWRGGALATAQLASLEVVQSAFRAVDALDRGGAVYVATTGSASVQGSAFCGVEAPLGGAMRGEGSALQMTVRRTLAQQVESTSNTGVAAAFDAGEGSLTMEHTTVLDVFGVPAYGQTLDFAENVVRLLQPADPNNLDPMVLPYDIDVRDSLIEDTLGTVASYPSGVYVEPIQMLGSSTFGPLPCDAEFRVNPLTRAEGFPSPGTLDPNDWGVLGGGLADGAPLFVGGVAVTGAPTAWSDDADGDGFALGVDCNDENAAVYPGAVEICDGVDNDCDGADDNIAAGALGATLGYPDDDGDGFAVDADTGKWVCDLVAEGLVVEVGDCDDQNDTIYPGALEACDGVDQDCADDLDGGVGDADAPLMRFDGDGDGFLGDGAAEERYCEPPATDADAVWWVDGEELGKGDCDDTDSAVFPGNTESCDGLDNDCDGLTDNVDPSTPDAEPWYLDLDTDRYGDDATETWFCDGVEPPGWVDEGGDCLDEGEGAIEVFPGAFDSCDDGLDNDCDGEVDNGGDTLWYPDDDGDGHPDADHGQLACEAPGPGWLTEAEADAVGFDCDDDDPTVAPGAEERCNRVDDDCDGVLDEGVGDGEGAVDVWPDADADRYGAADASPELACRGSVPPGWVDNALDCDDANPGVHPDADEVIGNEVDEDCDGQLGDRWAGGGGGCQTAGGAPLHGALVGLGLALLSRRRRRLRS